MELWAERNIGYPRALLYSIPNKRTKAWRVQLFSWGIHASYIASLYNAQRCPITIPSMSNYCSCLRPAWAAAMLAAYMHNYYTGCYANYWCINYLAVYYNYAPFQKARPRAYSE